MTKNEFFNFITSTTDITNEFLDNFFGDDMYKNAMNYIVHVPPFFTKRCADQKTTKEKFWNEWIVENNIGPCVCLYSNHDKNIEFWGFADKNDAIVFKTTWS